VQVDFKVPYDLPGTGAKSQLGTIGLEFEVLVFFYSLNKSCVFSLILVHHVAGYSGKVPKD
jgi:hypothetical protein